MPINDHKLSESRLRLLRLMQEVNYGKILKLSIEDGEPIYVPPPLCVKDWKLDTENLSRPELELPDFALKKQHHRLFHVFATIGNGTIDEIHVREGLPTRVVTSRCNS